MNKFGAEYLAFVATHISLIVAALMVLLMLTVAPSLLDFIFHPPAWFDAFCDSYCGHVIIIIYAFSEVFAIVGGGLAIFLREKA